MPSCWLAGLDSQCSSLFSVSVLLPWLILNYLLRIKDLPVPTEKLGPLVKDAGLDFRDPQPQIFCKDIHRLNNFSWVLEVLPASFCDILLILVSPGIYC